MESLPKEFICPITSQIFRDPVFTADGLSYERIAILRWFQEGHRTSPKTSHELKDICIRPNHELRDKIDTFLLENAAIREQLQRLDNLKKRIHAQPSTAIVRKFIDPISLNFMRDPVSS